ncbi:hypothetical protein BDU57DRAFT_538820 [Ampelomyces quisqualis]|uniref:Uncharacterized protein n=1 Tax=Ampelomyces quisqualis TaxID=50730 RepID=A0A6A5QMH1_AMPQU|nr:hypothetical protein BDU57DRAFT_538820 [Ampelomyces quisqualis]
MLVNCTNLTTLRLAINEHYLFRNDQTTLEDFLLRGKELKSEGFTLFQNVLKALPKLLDAEIEFPILEDKAERIDRLEWSEMMSFLHWAFTDERRNKLLSAAPTILEATKLPQAHGRVHLKSTGDQTYGREWAYEEWLALMELEQSEDEDSTA